MPFEFTATSFVGNARGSETGETFKAHSPETGEPVEPVFHSASDAELAKAASLAGSAFGITSRIPGKERANLLNRIASNLEALKDAVVERASLETGLPNARFEGETARTCGQLRLFAELVKEGSWVDARIDRADPGRSPIPKPDVRSMRKALGPVAVFCASNFPIAFSVAGGDTASALAAGCPVVVNANPAHPGTSEIAASAVTNAVSECGFPEGTFSLLFSGDYRIGSALVAHPAIKAVGFTGSRAGGRALMKIASDRRQPIPVFAEMSSVNPVFVLPAAAEERAETIAGGLFGSFTLGYGQFCTKPGLVFLPAGEKGDAMVSELRRLASEASPSPLLTARIRDSFDLGVSGRGGTASAAPGFAADTFVFETDTERFLIDRSLQEEVFGPATQVVRYRDLSELPGLAEELEGQLTVTVHASEAEFSSELLSALERKAGRIVFNGYPTGVEVCHAMVHGGPFPATSAEGTTSVGTRAIERFTRLVCFQDAPDSALPDELKEGNPLGISRMVDGVTGKDG